MTSLEVIADDVTGACDVGAELAEAGVVVRVAVDGRAAADVDDAVCVVNTQSRAVRAAEAYERVLRLTRRRPIDVLLKKIDTALRGHLGAELDGAIDGLGACAAFVAPAVPAAGRVTRGGCQWFGGRRLAETEFAADPEGAGAESSVAAVIARESRRRTEMIGLETVRARALHHRTRTLMGAGADVFVVDAECDDDLAFAAQDILELPRPLCIAGSIGVAAAVAARLCGGRGIAAADAAASTSRSATESASMTGSALRPWSERRSRLPVPALIVCGSLHSMARAQVDALCAAELAERIPLRDGGAAADHVAAVARALAVLCAGRSAVLAAPRLAKAADPVARRRIERVLGQIACEVLRAGAAAALVLIGGETSYAVLREVGATELVVHGRVAPLIAATTIARGDAVGLPLVLKGGSGGDRDTLRSLLGPDAAVRQAAG
jgi:uncharacterized protein YgbK (DUF1537 family)